VARVVVFNHNNNKDKEKPLVALLGGKIVFLRVATSLPKKGLKISEFKTRHASSVDSWHWMCLFYNGISYACVLDWRLEIAIAAVQYEYLVSKVRGKLQQLMSFWDHSSSSNVCTVTFLINNTYAQNALLTMEGINLCSVKKWVFQDLLQIRSLLWLNGKTSLDQILEL
jgi:hypothetical protein